MRGRTESGARAEALEGLPSISPLKEVIYGAAVKYATKGIRAGPTKLFVWSSDGVRQRLRNTSGIWEWVSLMIRFFFQEKK